MNTKMDILKKFWNDEDGQTTTEYVLILVLVVAIVMKFKEGFQNVLGTLIDTFLNDARQVSQGGG